LGRFRSWARVDILLHYLRCLKAPLRTGIVCLRALREVFARRSTFAEGIVTLLSERTPGVRLRCRMVVETHRAAYARAVAPVTSFQT
jgi:hypothetical protein